MLSVSKHLTQPCDMTHPTFPAPRVYVKTKGKSVKGEEFSSYTKRVPMGKPTQEVHQPKYSEPPTESWNVLSSSLTKISDGKMKLPSGEVNPAVTAEHEPTRIVQIFDHLQS